mmetsp:Transcript_1223/g.1398  ORF Transcript_1223/g.1398 Transcript_1223/m.1398 type:complete len:94 (+) Transcript_1223:426-707(+)
MLMSLANDKGETGSQWGITLQDLPALNGSKNTIFGRVHKGKQVIHLIEGLDDLRQEKRMIKYLQEQYNQGIENPKPLEKNQKASIEIINSGVF